MTKISCFEVLEMMNQYHKNEQWLAQNYQQIKKEHEGKFIAIDNEIIISSNIKIEDLINELIALDKFTTTIFIELISNRSKRYIL